MCARTRSSIPQLIPTAYRHASTGVEVWCKRYTGQPIVVLCQSGGTSSQAVAARLRHEGLEAQTLEGGYDAWRESRQALVRASKIPRRDDEGRTVWVTRARPKVVRVACPWLIHRFIDPSAVFLFVPPAEVAGVAEHATATPFDVTGASPIAGDAAVACVDQLDVEKLADIAQAGRNREIRAGSVNVEGLTTPFDGEWPQVPLPERFLALGLPVASHIEVPDRAEALPRAPWRARPVLSIPGFPH